MGQYYKPVLISEPGTIRNFLPHNYHEGAKLMEHSYIGNGFVADVLRHLAECPQRLYWIGDYAERRDFFNPTKPLSEKEMKEVLSSKYEVAPTEDSVQWTFNNAYIINHEKKEYLKLEVGILDMFQVCPLCLLTAVGNGKGGGDYFRENKDYVGIWAGDLISLSYELPKDCAGMKDVTDVYVFLGDD